MQEKRLSIELTPTPHPSPVYGGGEWGGGKSEELK